MDLGFRVLVFESEGPVQSIQNPEPPVEAQRYLLWEEG